MHKSYSLLVVMLLLITACGGNNPQTTNTPTAVLIDTPLPLPTFTATAASTSTPLPTLIIDGSNLDPEATEESHLQVIVEVDNERSIPPPINIILPEGWDSQVGTGVFEDVLGLSFIPYSAYSGPVTGGQGFIIVLWGFPSIITSNPLSSDVREVNLGADGMRLLRLSVMLGCNIGHSLELDQPFYVGGLIGLGTRFSAVDCSEGVDTRGWYTALNQYDINYAFYAYTEPINAMDGSAPDELQSILDTVEFSPLELPEATPERDE